MFVHKRHLVVPLVLVVQSSGERDHINLAWSSAIWSALSRERCQSLETGTKYLAEKQLVWMCVTKWNKTFPTRILASIVSHDIRFLDKIFGVSGWRRNISYYQLIYLNTGFPLFRTDKIPWLFQYFFSNFPVFFLVFCFLYWKLDPF